VKFRIYNSIFNYSKNYTYLQDFAASLLLTPLFFFGFLVDFLGSNEGRRGHHGLYRGGGGGRPVEGGTGLPAPHNATILHRVLSVRIFYR